MKHIAREKGTRFNMLTVKEHLGCLDGKTRYLMLCDCGNEKVLIYQHLVTGFAKSCGCIKLSKKIPSYRCDGMHTHPLCGVWKKMMNRCYAVDDKSYSNYGGRGISVYEPWHSAPRFLAEIPPKPEGRYHFDRIDNDGNYEPGNIRWVTFRESARNKQNTLYLIYEGNLRKFVEVIEETGLSRHKIMATYECKSLSKFGDEMKNEIITSNRNAEHALAAKPSGESA